MNKQKQPTAFEDSIGSNPTRQNRYYVQRVTEQVFVIRERSSLDKEPGTDDRFARAFSIRHDADQYVLSMNEKQRQLDEQFGHWVQSAL